MGGALGAKMGADKKPRIYIFKESMDSLRALTSPCPFFFFFSKKKNKKAVFVKEMLYKLGL